MILSSADPETRLDSLTGERRAAVLRIVAERLADVRARVWKTRRRAFWRELREHERWLDDWLWRREWYR